MKLYLVQHADALAKDIDPDRPLSQKGKEDIEKMAQFLKGSVHPDEVVHSGKTRAKQSANILVDTLAPDVSPCEIHGIGPNDSVEEFSKDKLQVGKNLLVVGHLPFMSKLVSFLVTDSTKSIVDFQPGSMVCLSSDEVEEWQIQWMVRPELSLK